MRPGVLVRAVLVSSLSVPLLAAAHLSTASGSPRSEGREVLAADWTTQEATVSPGTLLQARIDVSAGSRAKLMVSVDGGRVISIPSPCVTSSVIRKASFLDADGSAAVCLLRQSAAAQTISVDIQVGDEQGGRLEATARIGPREVDLPERTIGLGTTPTESLRLISSPDFVNADLADLARGPGSWTPRRSENGINQGYQRALADILDEWRSRSPDAVLVAGDLVDGRWGLDQRQTGNFGPVDSLPHRQAALRRAARTYYPQWVERFRSRGLRVYPAIGDHEYGDNPWPRSKRALSADFGDMFARHFTRTADGSARFPDHPRGEHAFTAYAWRPATDVQIVSIDPFDITDDHARIGMDRQQLGWLRRVLKTARHDHVRWTIVQGHVPILGPVRSRASSGLVYPRGPGSDLWQLMRRYHVDIYLCGEVHDVTATTRNGILQLAHGGAFQFGLTTFAQLDIYPNRVDVDLYDVESRTEDGADGSRLWETVRDGIKKIIHLDPHPFTIGTISIDDRGRFVRRSGLLQPWSGVTARERPRVLVP